MLSVEQHDGLSDDLGNIVAHTSPGGAAAADLVTSSGALRASALLEGIMRRCKLEGLKEC